MKVLVGCEESQAVTIAFRERGHEAYSCDIEPCSGGHPEWHLQMDVFKAIDLIKPELGIFFPPCTFLSKVSNAFFNEKKYGQKAVERKQKSNEAKDFFIKLWKSPIEKIAIENPIGFMSSWKKPDQIVQPWYFGDPVQKATCLWLKNLRRLNGNPENKKPEPVRVREGKRNRNVHYIEELIKEYPGSQHAERSKARSKTFPGLAKKMAETWG